MATENHEMSKGWPLGLQIMSMRLRLQERLQAASPAVNEPYSLHIPSSSFSSFSSSNLDTQSSASFFQDNSVSLGMLIGFRPHDRGSSLYFQNTIRTEESNRPPVTGACKDVSRGQSTDMSQGICIPLIQGALVKMSRNRSKSKQLDV
ncbi:uncharacterized protein LOC111280467 isoform X2 [Durio zibethinus]|uniref:Uncharacterized protein LOC111280467 isoform X2 n=1 Tax=Durio zibethinus TaxID=66656 RepID=A0A6P5X5D0_DURZI|nr:uncharacterized protein LOC111280467 isoform X2 [Durio zibethinus]